ncbi:MAG TPA: lipopolysaccharide kinase InaA family protein [Planctomycetota bacterium]|nr:lipopolysaccharide kinase InaA family protein [Planctomycetota bacterium]
MPEQLLNPDSAARTGGTPSPGPGSAVPPGFEVLRIPSRAAGWGGSLSRILGFGGKTLFLKSYFRDHLIGAGVDDPETLRSGPLVAGWIGGGRTHHALIRAEGEAWVLKAYRRGGLVGRWNSTRYWGRGRFLEELRVAALAEREGIPTAEVLAVIIERAGLGSVRAWLVTRYLPEMRPLHEYFGAPEEGEIFRTAGQVVRGMHKVGIDHPDLHVGNIVGGLDRNGPHAHIVDWDRARLRSKGTWSPNVNLIRLWRSVEKGRSEGAVRYFKAALRAFIRGYFEGRPSALRDARKYFRRRAFFLGLRIWLWRARR